MKLLKNKLVFYTLIIILFCIIIWFSSFTIKEKEKENFGYDNSPNEYIEPKVYKNFITENEANHILELSTKKFEDSTVVGGYNTSIRKSKTCWLSKSDSKIREIIKRVCDIDNHPIENAEDLQVVKYDPNGYYNEHHDSCCDENDKCVEFNKRGGNRIITMVIYLNDGFSGGATRFINLKQDIKPEKYSGILFHPMNKKKDKCHHNALHAGLPVISGQKYIANVWIREREFH
jgi:prolyl 4-hydroxylase